MSSWHWTVVLGGTAPVDSHSLLLGVFVRYVGVAPECLTIMMTRLGPAEKEYSQQGPALLFVET